MHESRRQDLRILGIEGQSVVYNTSPGPPVGAPLSVRAPLGHIKGRARPLEHRFTRTRGPTSFHTCRDRHSSSPSLRTSSGNTSHSGRRVLRSGGPNHSKSLCASVFLRLSIEYSLTAPKHILHLGLSGCILPP